MWPVNLRLPCRITVRLEGVEWFLYNRTPSFDTMLESLGVKFDEEHKAPEQDDKASAQPATRMASGRSDVTPKSPKKDRIDWLREALPIEILATSGSIVLGNRATPTLLIIGFRDVAGTYGAVKARAELLDM